MALTNPFASQESEMDKMCGNFNLTRTQRFYGFGICFGIGFLISFLSTFLLFSGNLTAFAILYSLGNVISLISTGFLTGFLSQFKRMFDQTRMTATLVFLGTLVATLISAFAIKVPILTIIFCIAQYFALLWYSISYIPFARDMVKNCFGGFLRR